MPGQPRRVPAEVAARWPARCIALHKLCWALLMAVAVAAATLGQAEGQFRPPQFLPSPAPPPPSPPPVPPGLRVPSPPLPSPPPRSPAPPRGFEGYLIGTDACCLLASAVGTRVDGAKPRRPMLPHAPTPPPYKRPPLILAALPPYPPSPRKPPPAPPAPPSPPQPRQGEHELVVQGPDFCSISGFLIATIHPFCRIAGTSSSTSPTWASISNSRTFPPAAPAFIPAFTVSSAASQLM